MGKKGKDRWIISSEWIIIYCSVHSTVLSSPSGFSTAPLLPRNEPIQRSLLKEKSAVGNEVPEALLSAELGNLREKTLWNPNSHCH